LGKKLKGLTLDNTLYAARAVIDASVLLASLLPDEPTIPRSGRF